MNFGQNLYNWFLSNAQSLVLLAISCGLACILFPSVSLAN